MSMKHYIKECERLCVCVKREISFIVVTTLAALYQMEEEKKLQKNIYIRKPDDKLDFSICFIFVQNVLYYGIKIQK